jgi:hypothetical protein
MLTGVGGDLSKPGPFSSPQPRSRSHELVTTLRAGRHATCCTFLSMSTLAYTALFVGCCSLGFGCSDPDTTPLAAGGDGGATVASSTSGPHKATSSTITGNGGGGAFAMAPHHAYPQVPDQGGPKLNHLHMVTVVQAADSQSTQLQAYGDWIVSSQWLTAVGAEYGVASGTHELVTLPGPAPTDVTTNDA